VSLRKEVPNAFITSCSVTRLAGHSSATAACLHCQYIPELRGGEDILSCTVAMNRCALHSGTWLPVSRRHEDRRRTEWTASPTEAVPNALGRARNRGRTRLELDASGMEFSCRCCNLPAMSLSADKRPTAPSSWSPSSPWRDPQLHLNERGRT
jgi:hypothetical protein